MANRVNAPLVWQADQFKDLSGASTTGEHFDNPYDALIHDAQKDPVQIQQRYENHRSGRNEQQKAKLLSPAFPGVSVDPVLSQMLTDPSYKDPRYCLVFWARPPQKVRELVKQIQDKIAAEFSGLWYMPQDCLHMTTLEITHSRTEADVEELVNGLKPGVPKLPDFTYDHRARLVKPLVSYDGSAFALSFVPAAGEGLSGGRRSVDDEYSYHHLRRDIYDLAEQFVEVDSRYTVPSSHLTLGRFIRAEEYSTPEGKPDQEKIRKLVSKFDEINDWLRSEYWPKDEAKIKDGGEWLVGEERGLDFRKGTLWYGGGSTVHLGKGF